MVETGRGGRFVLANLLIGRDGSTTLAGRSKGLSSPEDRRRFHELRKSADFILVGGNTARNEPYSVTPAPLIVITHGELPQELKSNPLARAVNAPLSEVLNALEGNIVIEAGPALLVAAIKDALVDELHLTITNLTPNENKISIEELTLGYEKISQEDVGEESFAIFIPHLSHIYPKEISETPEIAKTIPKY
jgi:riboflavin biosynthesis pyrimidine reductase